MQYRALGPSGIEASVIGFGAWAIGGWLWGGTDEQESIAAIQAALDNGITLIDSAPAYGFGKSEEIIGKAIKGRKREDIVLATKCGWVWHVEKGVFRGELEGHKVYFYSGEESLRFEVERSLKLLQTDYIDLYQVHWQDTTTPIEKTVAALLKLKEEGKIRAIGFSNVTPEQFDQYVAAGQVDSDQEMFSMLDRQHEETLIARCRKNELAFLAYSPMGSGLLTGKMSPKRVFAEGDRRGEKPRFSVENRERVLAMLEEFQPIAKKYDATLGQLAIAWTFSQPGVSHVLCGARNPKQAMENAAAGDIVLHDDDIQAINVILAKHAPGIE